MKMKHQAGVGMIEVLVALLLLAVGILGFTALQLRAVEATNEAMKRIQAMNIARDFAERIRVNPYALTVLKSDNSPIAVATDVSAYMSAVADNKDTTTQLSWDKCYQTKNCTSAALAVEDVKQVVDKANSQGMKLNLMACKSSVVEKDADNNDVVKQSNLENNRSCIYVAWDATTPTDGATNADCAQYGIYKKSAQCIILEAY